MHLVDSLNFEHRCVTNTGTFCKSNQALTCSFLASEENDENRSWVLEHATKTNPTKILALSPGLQNAYSECNDAIIEGETCILKSSDGWQQKNVDSIITFSTCKNALVSIE